MSFILTKLQAESVAKTLLGRTGFAFPVIERALGRNIKAEEADQVWDELEELGGVFKCSACETWAGASERDPSLEDTRCKKCVDGASPTATVGLSTDQINTITEIVVGTSKDVIASIEAVYGRPLSESEIEAFNAAFAQAGLFRCGSCRVWQPNEEKNLPSEDPSEPLEGVCADCVLGLQA